MAKSSYYDKKLGINTSVAEVKLKQNISPNIDNHGYQPTFYGRLEKMVKYLTLTPEDVFIDLGCGKGRVVFFVAMQKLKKVIGVELDRDIFIIAQKNLRNLKINKTFIELINSDAATFDIREGTIFFFFNPFGFKTFNTVINNIKESLIVNPRIIRIVYYGPEYAELLDNQNWLIREGKIENNGCPVWRNKFSHN